VSDCLFCRIAGGDAGATMVHEDDQTVAFLDARPVFKGHTLLVPRSHVPTLPDLPDDLLGPFFGTGRRLSVAVRDAMEAEGTFVAINNVVSQSVPHLHLHVVPRRPKDGLRGFFWPRTRYDGPEEMEAIASSIRSALRRSSD
jgi:histidine triad (HIT) family protein